MTDEEHAEACYEAAMAFERAINAASDAGLMVITDAVMAFSPPPHTRYRPPSNFLRLNLAICRPRYL